MQRTTYYFLFQFFSTGDVENNISKKYIFFIFIHSASFQILIETLENKMQKILIFLLCLVAVATASIDPDGQGKRMLVLLDNYGLRETHSTFFKSLKNRGFQLTYKLADDSELSLSKYNEYLFDHLVLFCPNVVEFGGSVSTKAVVDFIDAGGNVLVGANSQLSEPIKEIAAECGVEFSDEDTFVIDRFNADVNDEGYGTLIANDAKYLINNKLIVGEKARQGAPVLYRGVG